MEPAGFRSYNEFESRYNEFKSRYNEFKSRYNENKSRYYDFLIKIIFFTHGTKRASYHGNCGVCSIIYEVLNWGDIPTVLGRVLPSFQDAVNYFSRLIQVNKS